MMHVIILQNLTHPFSDKILVFTANPATFMVPKDFEVYDCRQVTALEGFQLQVKCSPFDVENPALVS